MYTPILFVVGPAVKVPEAGPSVIKVGIPIPAPADPEDAAVIRPSASTVIEAAV
jgi:hypothetical protein